MNTIDMSTSAGATPPVQRVRLRHHPLLGGLLVREGLINQTQLERALALQHEMEPRPLLGQVLLDQKLVTPHELNAALGKYQRKHLLGDVLIETKAVTPAQLDAALATQRKTDRALGDALIHLGFITERQLKHALAIQLRIPFVDLEQHAIEPSLRSVLSESYARHHRVLPIAKDDDRIVLAMDDPTDLEIVAEVRSCTGHRIDVVTATADAMEHAFSRLYGVPGDARPPEGSSAVAATEPPGAGETEHAMRPAAAPRPAASLPDRGEPAQRKGSERARSGVAIDAIRARMESLRQFARGWERSIDGVEALFHERGEGRAEIERLSGELREGRAALARAAEALEAKAQDLTRLETAHAALLQERAALERALADLQERHDALVRDREFAIDHLSAVLRQLRS